MSNSLNSQIYSGQNRREYLLMMDKIGIRWLTVFDTTPENKTFWDTAYWDLLTKLWKAETEVKKTDAINYIIGKTTPTAAKYLNNAIKSGFITERDNPNDPRSKLIGLSGVMKQRLDDYFDAALMEMETLLDNIKDNAELSEA